MKHVLDVLKKEKLYLKMSKCEFWKISLVYLVHIVGGGELKIDPSKDDVIVTCLISIQSNRGGWDYP